MTTPRHLVAIWNPSYAADALDEHLRILLAWSARSSAGDAQPEDVYVWWARLRSPALWWWNDGPPKRVTSDTGSR